MKVRLLLNIFKIAYLKIKYSYKIKVGWIQLFGENTKIEIKGKSLVKVGKSTYSRNNLNILVENGNLNISNGTFFNNNCSITSLNSITIGNNCSFGNNVVIVDHDHDYKSGSGFITSEVKIGNNVWVGANSVILRGTIIGDNCVIGAGSIVKGIINDNTLYYQEKEIKMTYIKINEN